MNFVSKVFSPISDPHLFQIQSYILLCGISCAMFHSLEVKGNISFIFFKEN